MRSGRYGRAGIHLSLLMLAAVGALLSNAGCGLPTTVSPEVTGPDRGDVNEDGVIDQADLDLATEAFGRTADDPLFVPAADLTGDGVIGLDDLRALVVILKAQETEAGA